MPSQLPLLNHKFYLSKFNPLLQKMSSVSLSKSITLNSTSLSLLSPTLSLPQFPNYPKPPYPQLKSSSSPRRKTLTLVLCKSSEEAEVEEEEDEWLKRLPEKKKPLYAHSLPCIEAWLGQLGFCQSKEDLAAWSVEKVDWHANLNLDVTDLYIRYLKAGPGNLEKDVERRFSYALSREDIENAILGGP